MPKVLIVEDDANIRALLERRLGQLGHRVMAACSAEDALAVVSERGAPDVFVLDVLMPGVSGLELLTRLRQDPTYADVPAIFLSGRVKDSDIAAGQALGATYLTKPVVMSALAAANHQGAAGPGGNWWLVAPQHQRGPPCRLARPVSTSPAPSASKCCSPPVRSGRSTPTSVRAWCG